jgi:hypothetical protein
MSSIYPLDKNRQVMAEYSDPDGYIHKVRNFRTINNNVGSSFICSRRRLD